MSAVEVLAPGELSLNELAAEANREHAAVEDALVGVIMHAIAAGKALLQARRRVALGNWHEWLADNFAGSRELASRYMRLAHYEDIVLARPWADEQPKVGNQWTHDRGAETTRAWEYLRGLPPVSEGRAKRYDEATHEEARRLHTNGVSYREIGRMLGVNHHTIARWCDADYARRRKQEQNRRKKRERAEAARRKAEARDRAIARIKGPGPEAYALLRKAAQLLDRAASESSKPEERAAFLCALDALPKAEDEVVRALRAARTL
jgi:hypothetical protein